MEISIAVSGSTKIIQRKYCQKCAFVLSFSMQDIWFFKEVNTIFLFGAISREV